MRHLAIGQEVPVLYLETDPATVTRGKPGDSSWHLLMQNYDWLWIGAACFHLVPWLVLAVLLAACGIRYLVSRFRNLTRRAKGCT
jgi:hypothetical protein